MSEQRLKPLRGEGARLLKLVTESEDLQTLEQALELGNALGQPAENLLDGVDVTAAGELLPSSRFRGTKTSQPALDLLLIHQLSLALEGSPEANLRRSVRRLQLMCRIVPPLRGFDGLESLTIEMAPGVKWADFARCEPLPALRVLSLTSKGTKDQITTLEALDGLKAPRLEVIQASGLGLKSVDALATSSRLIDVDLSDNPGLRSIRGLAPSAASLTTLNLKGCADLPDIEALRGSQALETLNLKGCAHLRSLMPLTASERLTRIDLEGCAQLTSLEGLATSELAPVQYNIFSLHGCAALTSLRGLPTLSEMTSALHLREMPALRSMDGIAAARVVKTLEIDNTALTDLVGLEHLSSLSELRVIECKSLQDIRILGQLSALERVRLFGCSGVQHLPDAWGQTLRNLEFSAGAFTALGQMPAGLEGLDVRGVPTLQNLKGVETATSLQVVAVDTLLRDASALQGLPLTSLRCFQADVRPVLPITPAWLHAVAGRLEPLRLDLSFTNLKEVPVLVEFPHLHAVRVSYQTCEFYQLKGGDYLTESAVRTLQRAVCKRHQIPTPEFLKSRRTSNQAVVAGGPSLLDLKRGLTSTDFTDVVAALETLRTTASAALYDAVVEGVHGPALYSGDTAALGKLFKDIRAPYRPWARWALTHVLMDAPDAATRAVALRQSVQAIVLTVSLSEGQSKSRPIPLSRFKALESITLQGIPGNDLSFLHDAGSVKSITLQDMIELTSLETLALMSTLPTLQTLQIERCPALSSLKGLEGAVQLRRLVVDGADQLIDFSAMAGLRSLQAFPARYFRSEEIDFSGFAALTNIQFAAGLRAATALKFHLTGQVDLSPLERLPHLASVALDLDTLQQDFAPLSQLKALDIQLIDPKTGYTQGVQGKVQPEHRHNWRGEYPLLERLEVSGGEHDLTQLRAPALQSFKSDSRLASLRGVGHAGTLEFRLDACESLDGLAGSPVKTLDFYYSVRKGTKLPSLAVIHEVPELKSLRIGPSLTEAHLHDLSACAQVQRLQANHYSGSLAFLAGWMQLAEIDLRDSGELTDLGTLCSLPSLTRVRLRGAAIKRESWPKALQDRLDFRST